MPAGSPREMARRRCLAWASRVGLNMVRWVLLVGLVLGLVNGVQRGWIELHWDQLLQDAGLPLGPERDRPAQPTGAEGP
jgi:hypothetical protein